MKKITLLFAAGTMLWTACSNEPTYNISGTIENVADGEMVYLQEIKGREFVKLDSAVVTNGIFTFKGRQDVATNRYIAYIPKKGRGPRMDFFLENGNITVTLGEESKVAGTQNNDIYQNFKNESARINKEKKDLYMKMRTDSSLTNENRDAISKQLEKIESKHNDYIYQMIDANIANPVGIHLFPNHASTFSLEQQKALIAKIPTEYLNNERIEKIVKRIEVIEKTAIGQKFTDFTLPDLTGNPIKLSDIISKNKYTLIDFWASWCGPYRTDLPHTKAAYKEYNKKGFGIVGVSLDNDAVAWKKAIKDMDMIWEHLSDIKGWQCEAATLYGVNAIPATILVAQDGTIIARNLRGEAIKEKLAELLK